MHTQAPTNLDPLTLIGDSMWVDLTVTVTALVNGSTHGNTSVSGAPLVAGGGGGHAGTIDMGSRVTDPPVPPPQPPYVRVCGGCGDTSVRGLSYGCDEGCCFQVSQAGNWSLGHRGSRNQASGVVKGFTDTWHKIRLDITKGTITAALDGVELGSAANSCVAPTPVVFPGHGMVGLGCGAYHYCQYSSFAVVAK